MNISLFELNKVYQEEANQLAEARRRSKIIHNSGNIDASGDEIELPFRAFLKRRLPSQYYISQGHIVDKELKKSPQLDVIVADNSAVPILFKGENGTDYIPFESVYLFGEVKSTYQKSKHYISAFSDVYRNIKTNLQREQTPANYIGNNINLGEGLSFTTKDPYRNPLYSFMFFVDSGDIDEKHLRSEYANLSDEYLPNIVCFADGKIIIKSTLVPHENKLKAGSIDTGSHRILSNNELHWLMLEFTNKDLKGGQALSILITSIFEHLNNCILKPPNISKYMKQIFDEAGHTPRLVKLNKNSSDLQTFISMSERNT